MPLFISEFVDFGKYKTHLLDSASADDPELITALTKYHQEGLLNNTLIMERLLAEYGINARSAY